MYVIELNNLLESGYIEYSVPEFKKDSCQKFLQKRIKLSDREDDDLFIDILGYDFTPYGESWHWCTEVQFYKTNGGAVDISIRLAEFQDIPEMESFYKRLKAIIGIL